jgi:NADPH-dependent glutamate synthase beta subunit-like oxidoreductase
MQVAIPGEYHHRDLIACQRACPVHTDARGYVRAIAEGRFAEGYLIARGPNPLASICGRVCGAPCEAACRRGRIPRVDADGRFVGTDLPIAIRALKRIVCERYGAEVREPAAILKDLETLAPAASEEAEEMAALLRGQTEGRFAPANGERIAIVGAGPAGLAAAHDLALLGMRPIVYEREPIAAGMLALGVPAYRLPRELIRREIAVIEALGAEIRTGVVRQAAFDTARTAARLPGARRVGRAGWLGLLGQPRDRSITRSSHRGGRPRSDRSLRARPLAWCRA